MNLKSYRPPSGPVYIKGNKTARFTVCSLYHKLWKANEHPTLNCQEHLLCHRRRSAIGHSKRNKCATVGGEPAQHVGDFEQRADTVLFPRDGRASCMLKDWCHTGVVPSWYSHRPTSTICTSLNTGLSRTPATVTGSWCQVLMCFLHPNVTFQACALAMLPSILPDSRVRLPQARKAKDEHSGNCLLPTAWLTLVISRR